MQRLNPDAYARLTQGAQVLAVEHLGGTRPRVKLLELADGSYLKLFHCRRLLSSQRLFPTSRRFQRSADRLASLGIPTVAVQEVYRLTGPGRTAVRYRPLEGRCLEEWEPPEVFDGTVARDLGRFVARLHDLGVYFRALHFGNILRLPGGGFGLVDIGDMRFYHKPLGWRHRRRNFRHLLRRHRNRELLAPWREAFWQAYCQAAGLPARQEQRLSAFLQRHLSPSLAAPRIA